MSPKAQAAVEHAVQGVLSPDAGEQAQARQRLQSHMQHFLTVCLLRRTM